MKDLGDKYKAMRSVGCRWFTSGFIAFHNYMFGVPKGIVGLFNVVIEYEVDSDEAMDNPRNVEKDKSKTNR